MHKRIENAAKESILSVCRKLVSDFKTSSETAKLREMLEELTAKISEAESEAREAADA